MPSCKCSVESIKLSRFVVFSVSVLIPLEPNAGKFTRLSFWLAMEVGLRWDSWITNYIWLVRLKMKIFAFKLNVLVLFGLWRWFDSFDVSHENPLFPFFASIVVFWTISTLYSNQTPPIDSSFHHGSQFKGTCLAIGGDMPHKLGLDDGTNIQTNSRRNIAIDPVQESTIIQFT